MDITYRQYLVAYGEKCTIVVCLIYMSQHPLLSLSVLETKFRLARCIHESSRTSRRLVLRRRKYFCVGTALTHYVMFTTGNTVLQYVQDLRKVLEFCVKGFSLNTGEGKLLYCEHSDL